MSGKQPKDVAALEEREVTDEENPDLATYRGPDGSKSPGYLKQPPKEGQPTDADDAGRPEPK